MNKVKRIFISYGHDKYAILAEHLKDGLKKRGHEVWFDRERLIPGRDWERYIEDGSFVKIRERVRPSIWVV